MRIIKIGFCFSRNDSEADYDATSWVPVANREQEEKTIGKQLNAFLSQAGFYRPNGYIFMESLTLDEMIAVGKYLEEYRKEAEKDSTESEVDQ